MEYVPNAELDGKVLIKILKVASAISVNVMFITRSGSDGTDQIMEASYKYSRASGGPQ